MTIPTPHHSFLQAGCSSWGPTNSVKELKANIQIQIKVENVLDKDDSPVASLNLLDTTNTSMRRLILHSSKEVMSNVRICPWGLDPLSSSRKRKKNIAQYV